MRCKTAEPCSVPDQAHSHRLFNERTLAITSPKSRASAKMATAIIIWVRRRPHSERSGRFRLSQVLSCHFTMSTCEGPPFPVSRIDCLVYHLRRRVSRHPWRQWDQVSITESVLPVLRHHPVIPNQTEILNNKGRTALTFSQDSRRVRRTYRRGIHGSTSEHRNGLCAVVPVSHTYQGATASDLTSEGECEH